MRPAFSVIFLTTLIGAGQGLFVWSYLMSVAAAGNPQPLPVSFFIAAGVVTLVLLGLGLFASFFHLGHPERAWRAVTRWRTSWLSREVIALPLFGLAVLVWTALVWQQGPSGSTLGVGAMGVLLAIALYVCTGMIYAAIKVLREWSHPLTVFNFIAIGLASGAILTTLLAEWFAPASGAAATLRSLALWLLVVAAAMRGYAMWRNAKLPPLAPARAIGVHHARVQQRSQGAMGGSFNTREFFHGQSEAVVAKVRWAALLAGFGVPWFLLAVGAPALLVFLIHYLGLLAERWYFFAEAKHPQNLYYQTVG